MAITISYAIANMAWAGIDARQAHITLQKAVDTAVYNSPAISKAFARLKTAKAQRLGANAAFLPSVSLTDTAQLYQPLQGATSTVIAGALVSATQRFYSNSISANLNLNLYDGGKDVANYQGSLDAIRSAESGLLAVLNDVLDRVLDDYEAVAVDQITIAAQHAIIAIDQDVEGLTEQRLQARFASRVDLIAAQQETLQAMTQEIQSRQQLSSDQEKLNIDMGNAAANESLIVDPTLPEAPTPEHMHTSARFDPAVEAAQAQVEADREQVKAAQASYYPKVAITGQYNMLGADPGTIDRAITATRGSNYAIGLSISIPLLPFEDTESSVDQALAHVDESRSAYRAAFVAAATRSVSAKRRLLEATRASTVAKQSAMLAAENESLVHARFLAQQSSRIDLDKSRVASIESDLSAKTTEMALRLAAWKVFRSADPEDFFNATIAAVGGGNTGLRPPQ